MTQEEVDVDGGIASELKASVSLVKKIIIHFTNKKSCLKLDHFFYGLYFTFRT